MIWRYEEAVQDFPVITGCLMSGRLCFFLYGFLRKYREFVTEFWVVRTNKELDLNVKLV